MKIQWFLGAVLGAAVSLVSNVACVAEVGQACDGFFSNGCNSPASCVEGPNGSFCATSCERRDFTEPGPSQYCKDPALEPVEVTVETPQGDAPMGCMCVPKST